MYLLVLSILVDYFRCALIIRLAPILVNWDFQPTSSAHDASLRLRRLWLLSRKSSGFEKRMWFRRKERCWNHTCLWDSISFTRFNDGLNIVQLYLETKPREIRILLMIWINLSKWLGLLSSWSTWNISGWFFYQLGPCI